MLVSFFEQTVFSIESQEILHAQMCVLKFFWNLEIPIESRSKWPSIKKISFIDKRRLIESHNMNRVYKYI